MDAAEPTAKLIEELGITIPLLSDPKLQVIARYGVVDDNKKIALPATFIIGRDHKIHWRYIGKNPGDRPDSKGLIRIAETAK